MKAVTEITRGALLASFMHASSLETRSPVSAIDLPPRSPSLSSQTADSMQAAYKRGDPWFDDGNIVLLADGSNVAFKIHRDFLSRHSEVFQSMFQLPQPSSDVETMDDCQVVRMYDLPAELSNLIKALYDGTGP